MTCASGAMDWLLDIAGDLEREVFWQVATLLDHEVDLLFFDTTSTYFETDHPDDPVVRDTHARPVPDPPNSTDISTDPDGTDPAPGDTTVGGVGFRPYGKSKDSRCQRFLKIDPGWTRQTPVSFQDPATPAMTCPRS